MTQTNFSEQLQSVVQDYTIDVVIPAAGVGKRMGADRPKQYLTVNDKSILAHTVDRMCELDYVRNVILAISDDDEYFQSLKITAPFNRENVRTVSGGKERADSVLAGLNSIKDDDNTWVLVHDGARPNIAVEDINCLVFKALNGNCGGILASPVKDTIKRSLPNSAQIKCTVPRESLWHALTPQFFRLNQLRDALAKGLKDGASITDEASAIEYVGQQVLLVEGRSDNIKVTQPEDLDLIRFYLQSS